MAICERRIARVCNWLAMGATKRHMLAVLVVVPRSSSNKPPVSRIHPSWIHSSSNHKKRGLHPVLVATTALQGHHHHHHHPLLASHKRHLAIIQPPSVALNNHPPFHRSFSSRLCTTATATAASSSSSSSSFSTDLSNDNEQQDLSSRPSLIVYYNDVYQVQLPPHHRFPMEKYQKVRSLLQSWILAQEQQEQEQSAQDNTHAKVTCEFRKSPLATMDELITTHSLDYVQRFLAGNQTQQELRNVGFPWSLQGVDRALSSTGPFARILYTFKRTGTDRQPPRTTKTHYQHQQRRAGVLMWLKEPTMPFLIVEKVFVSFPKLPWRPMSS